MRRFFNRQPHSGAMFGQLTDPMSYLSWLTTLQGFKFLRGKVQTPNIDRLEIEGRKFTDAHSPIRLLPNSLVC